MIRLTEREGKALLARHGIPIPRGSVYPELPQADGGRYMVKAQVLSGGRGKQGGVVSADGRSEVARAAAGMQGLRISGEAPGEIYVEERLPIATETYLCAMVDRDRGMPVIMACAQGGVDIESVPAARILRRPVHPLLGLRPYAIEEIVRFLDRDGTAHAGLREVVSRLHAALLAEDAELLEINPLAILEGGRVTAIDAKCVLDEDAAFRHPGRSASFKGTAFEVRARQLGTVGLEMDGEIAAIMNGAGMTMATLDEITAAGGRVKALVELHGVMAEGPERIAEVVGLVCSLQPAVLLINVYFQFRSLDTIAQGLVLAARRGVLPSTCKLIIRFRGVDEARARDLLAGVNCTLTSSFAEACTLTLEHARAARSKAGA